MNVEFEKNSIYLAFHHFINSINSYQCEELCGGLSDNTQYTCTVNGKKYVVRLLKTSYSERYNETLIHKYFSQHSIAPHLYYYANDYSCIIMDFLDIPTLTVECAQEKKVIECVADTIRFMHHSILDDDIYIGNANTLHDIIRWRNTVKMQNNNMPTYLEEILSILPSVCKSLEKYPMQSVLSHNDIHLRNAFFIDNKIVLIDWETVGMNDPFFDVANYSLYACLNETQEYNFLTAYLQCHPTQIQLDHFYIMKLLILVYNIFGWFAFIGSIPPHISLDSVQDFSHYATIFAQNNNHHPDLLFELPFSLVNQFFHYYEIAQRKELLT